jgi:hypothetical protein
MHETDRELEKIWRGRHKEHYGETILIDEVAEVFHKAAAPEIMAVRTCRSSRCRRIGTCRRPQTCREPAMVDHREFMEIAAEIAAKDGIPNPFAPPKT